MSGILEISTIVGCRVGCDYCPQSDHVRVYAERGGPHVMTLDLFKRCVSSVPNDVEIVFAGMSEPFLNPAAVRMIDHAARRHEVSVYSTLAGLAAPDIPVLAKIDFREFCIHVPDDGDRMNIPIDSHYMTAFAAACACLPKRHFTCIGKPHPKLAPLLPKLNDDTSGLLSRAGNLTDRAIPRKTGRLKELPCMRHNVLLPDGSVVLCCMDYSQKSILGNLTTMKYEELFTGAEFQRVLCGLTDETKEILCRHCEVAEIEK